MEYLNNGGELFATPAGTELARIQDNEEYKNGILYVENNFNPNKRWPQMPNYMFIIADMNTGDVIGFDLRWRIPAPYQIWTATDA